MREKPGQRIRNNILQINNKDTNYSAAITEDVRREMDALHERISSLEAMRAKAWHERNDDACKKLSESDSIVQEPRGCPHIKRAGSNGRVRYENGTAHMDGINIPCPYCPKPDCEHEWAFLFNRQRCIKCARHKPDEPAEKQKKLYETISDIPGGGYKMIAEIVVQEVERVIDSCVDQSGTISQRQFYDRIKFKLKELL